MVASVTTLSCRTKRSMTTVNLRCIEPIRRGPEEGRASAYYTIATTNLKSHGSVRPLLCHKWWDLRLTGWEDILIPGQIHVNNWYDGANKDG